MMFEKQFTELLNACAFADAIVETVREPMLVLDAELRVVAASRAFCRRFKVDLEDTEGRHLYELGDGQWDIPKLHALLEKIIPDKGVMDDYEVAHEFPDIGQRIMLLNAREVFYETAQRTHILLGIEDISERRALEREKDELLQQKDVLLHEMQHRVANSLQIIASIIMLKARTVNSEEVRRHLQDAHKRVISVAAVQQHLHTSVASGFPAAVDAKPYLSTLCEALAASMIGEGREISMTVGGEGGNVSRRDAESLGLITTELVINALKHAFKQDRQDGRITVAFDMFGTDWRLSVADNGVGIPSDMLIQAKPGLGTGIVTALAKQLDAKIDTVSGSTGTTVSVTHATFHKIAPTNATATKVRQRVVARVVEASRRLGAANRGPITEIVQRKEQTMFRVMAGKQDPTDASLERWTNEGGAPRPTPVGDERAPQKSGDDKRRPTVGPEPKASESSKPLETP